MEFAGLQPMTLLDYPEKMAATLFTAGCNFACRFCYNPQLVLPEKTKQQKMQSEQEILNFLQERQGWLEGVCITGGEPTLQPDLLDFCRRVKALGYLVKVDSNGLKPEVLEKLIAAQVVDFIAMDIKAPKTRYAEIVNKKIFLAKIEQSIKLLQAWQARQKNLAVEFRTTLVPGLHQAQDVLAIAQWLAGSRRYVLQNFVLLGPLVDPTFKLAAGFTPAELDAMADLARPLITEVLVRYNV
jgi:pyruvate formate lyase activating enzyme